MSKKIEKESFYLSQENQDWLLEESNPAVRYFTLLHIQNKKETDTEVIEAKKQIMKNPPVSKILSHQNPDGSFLTDKMILKYGEIRAKSGYLPKYKATIWQAIFLAQLGADQNDKRIKKLGKYILDTNYSEKYKTIGIYEMNKKGIFFDVFPCYISNMVWALSKLGFYQDDRIQDSIQWILKYQRFDDGNFQTPDEYPYKGRKDRCFGKHSCYIGCTQALKAMTVIPEKERTIEIKEFIKRAIDFILLHKIYKKSRTKNEPIRKVYELLRFPFMASDGIMEMLETLFHFQIKDRSIDETLNFILSKRNENNRWILEKTISRSSIYTKFENLNEESKWITYKVLNLLKIYEHNLANGFALRND